MNQQQINILLEHSKNAMKNAYSPYSNFSVGAALLTTDNQIITGCNVENASYGLTICAERNAIFSAVNQGYKKNNILAIAISASATGFSPCGACRQVIAEFGENISVIFEYNGKIEVQKIKNLLPFEFDLI